MKKYLKYLFLFMAFMSPISALADSESEATTALLEMFDVYCEILVREGVPEIDGISIERIREKAHDVKLVVVSSLSIALLNSPGAVRKTAYWDPDNQTLFVSKAHLQASSDFSAFKGLFIHEMFRAVGISDDNYNTSAVIESYLDVRSELLEQTLKLSPQTIVNPLRIDLLKTRILQGGLHGARGGISGVGGGGDFRSLNLKRRIVNNLFAGLDKGEISNEQFVRCLNILEQLRIEVASELLPGSVSFQTNGFLILVSVDLVTENFDSLKSSDLILRLSRHLKSLAASGQ
ncbi:MAG: hypothetical protein EOP05_03335 [Proteobacteria bacterium]|nr:MAG: hypothetical protein EOP05_03335 [Pseudomonadota bacterium]